eukprot:907124-Amphidinium_carterae.1
MQNIKVILLYFLEAAASNQQPPLALWVTHFQREQRNVYTGGKALNILLAVSSVAPLVFLAATLNMNMELLLSKSMVVVRNLACPSNEQRPLRH